MLSSNTGRDVITYDARGMGNSLILPRGGTKNKEHLDHYNDASLTLTGKVCRQFTMENMALDALTILPEIYKVDVQNYKRIHCEKNSSASLFVAFLWEGWWQ